MYPRLLVYLDMILLTKLNDRKILVSLETIKYLESIPDTLIMFTNGESVVVKETLNQVTDAIVDYKARVLREANVK